MYEDILEFSSKYDSDNFVDKVAYLYDEMETTSEKQVFRENTFRENIRYITIPSIIYHTRTSDA